MAETGAAADMGPVTQPGLTPWERFKCIFGGSAGNLVEWYDWFAYTLFTVHFAPSFFPADNPTALYFKAALLNLVSFAARPIGAWLMGLYADIAGRRTALMVSVSMMCGGSLVIACCPTYKSIGILAPIILCTARFIQGLSVGGEYGASATYMSEMASRQRRGFWASFQYVTLIMGQLIALFVLITLAAILNSKNGDPRMGEWGWRIPFFIGAGLAVVVFWMRRGIHESVSYTNMKAAGHERVKTMMLFKRYPKETLIIVFLTAGGSMAYYAYTAFMQKFLELNKNFTKEQASQIGTIYLMVFMFAQPLFGALSDKVGRKVMLLSSFGIGTLIAYPMMTAIAKETSFVMAAVLCCIPLLVLSGYTSISGLIKAELFPAHVRALGVALPYSIGNALFGGTSETIGLKFRSDGNQQYYYIYMTLILAIAFGFAVYMQDTKRHSKIIED